MEIPPSLAIEQRIAAELVRWAITAEKSEAREALTRLYSDPLLSVQQSVAARNLAANDRSVIDQGLIDGMWRHFHTLLLAAKARQKRR